MRDVTFTIVAFAALCTRRGQPEISAHLAASPKTSKISNICRLLHGRLQGDSFFLYQFIHDRFHRGLLASSFIPSSARSISSSRNSSCRSKLFSRLRTPKPLRLSSVNPSNHSRYRFVQPEPIPSGFP